MAGPSARAKWPPEPLNNGAKIKSAAAPHNPAMR
jgi:hypothetical protein